jgi:N utilization substance protein A
MSKIPLKLVVGTVSSEKGVSEDVIFGALESALALATKKKHGSEIDVRVAVDRKTGNYETFRRWWVVEDPEPGHGLSYPLTEITLSAVQLDNPEMKVGDVIEEPIESIEFGRIAANTAKGVIYQEVKKAEQLNIATKFLQEVGNIIQGTVVRMTANGFLVDLGDKAEALLKKDQILPREQIRINDRVRAILMAVELDGPRGPQILLSRTHQDMLIALFKLEVPEVSEGVIEIKCAARDPGVRAKIAVKTNDGRMDPIGACVGMRGARVQAVSNELGGERVDIVLWDPDPVQFVMNAMAPAEVMSVVVDDDKHSMDLAVSEETLSQAIGRNGQNIRLASDLTGWRLNVITEKEAKEKTQNEENTSLAQFMRDLHVDETVASVLIEEGFTTLEEVAYVPIEELLEIDGFEPEMVNALRARAKDMLVTQAIATEEAMVKNIEPDLLAVPGVTRELALQLAKNSIFNREALAELAVDDLLDISDLNAEQASTVIMAARAHWFENKE